MKADIKATVTKVLSKLQKRDGLFCDDQKEIDIVGNKFTELELAQYIGIVLLDQHSVPRGFLRFYLKSKDCSFRVYNDQSKIDLVQKLVGDFRPTKQMLAGGSLANCHLVENQHGVKTVIKSAQGWACTKLKNEANYLTELSTYPEIVNYLPKVLATSEKKDTYILELEYYLLETLSWKLLFTNYSAQKAWEMTHKVVSFCLDSLWNKNLIPVPSHYIESFFINRIVNNTHMMEEKSPILKQLAKPQELIINNDEYLNMHQILKYIKDKPELLEKLTPPYLSYIWGDLHPNNILVDVDKSHFILLDPRGEPGDYLYDLGKLYHTFGPGRYDFLDNDLFSVTADFNSDVVIKRRFYSSHPAWNKYEVIQSIFELQLKNFIDKTDTNWELRWKFLKFCIYATMPLFLIKNDKKESRALMGYSNAVIFGNEFINYVKQYG